MDTIYRLSITTGTENEHCPYMVVNTKATEEDTCLAEFVDLDEANFYIDNCFTRIVEGGNYNYYLRK